MRRDIRGTEPAEYSLAAYAGANDRGVERLQQALRVGDAAHRLGRRRLILQIGWDHHLRADENVLLCGHRGNPGADVADRRHAFIDRGNHRGTGFADKRQQDILDRHASLP
jgi:hypothetical protein